MVDDTTLIQQAQHHPAAFGALYDRYVDRIHAYAYRLTQDAALAQDVTAATFEKALRMVREKGWQDTTDSGSGVSAWLYRIAHNEAMSQHRRRKWLAPWRAWRGGSDARTPETAVLAAERRQRLHAALARLSLADRNLLLLRYVEEFSPGDVARILNCSPNAAYLRLHRALQRLQQQMTLLETTAEVLPHVQENA